MTTSHTPGQPIGTASGAQAAAAEPDIQTLRRRLQEVQGELEQARASEQASRSREQQLATHNLVLVNLSRSTAIEQGNVGVACREITHAAAHTLGVERVSVWLFVDDRTRIGCLDLYERSRDVHSSGLQLDALEYPSYFRALEEDRTIAAEDARNDPRTQEFAASYLVPLGITSMLDAPVRIGGKCIGLVCHEHVGAGRAWTLEDQAFAGSMADFVAMTLQAEQRRTALEQLRESEHRLRQVIDLVPHMIFAKDRRGRFVLANRTVAEALGTTVDQVIGRSHRALHDAGDEATHMLEDDLEVIETNQLKFIPCQPFTDARGHTRILQTTKMPFTMGAQREPAVLGVSIDITEAKRFEERQADLIAELDHRVKNTLAAVLSLAEQTAAHAPDIRHFVPTFTGRIRAMSIAHELLARTGWEGADLAEMLPRVIEPFARLAEDRILLRGGPTILPASVAPSLALVLQELITNAVRHGSLSHPSGRLDIQWEIQPAPAESSAGGEELRLKWIERGGPSPAANLKRRFGLRLIERTVTYQHHGQAKLEFTPRGFQAELTIPISAAGEHRFPRPLPANGYSPHARCPVGEFKNMRVLVVEDDYLVSESIGNMLTTMGCEMVGPASTAEDACRIVKNEPIDAAILDVKLSPGSSAPVARALQYKRCPFMFLTGYSSNRLLPDDLRGYRVLAKPVDRDSLCAAMHELKRSPSR